MGGIEWLVGVVLAGAGVWYARSQLYVKRRVLAWSSVSFQYEKESPLPVKLEPALSHEIATVETPIIVDVAFELQAIYEYSSPEERPGTDSKLEEYPIRIRAAQGSEIKQILFRQNAEGATDQLTELKDGGIGVWSARLRPREPVMVSFVTDGVSEILVENSWPDTKAVKHGLGKTLSARYMVEDSSPRKMRNIWPKQITDESSYDREASAESSDNSSIFRLSIKAIKVVLSVGVVAYVGLAIYADTQKRSTWQIEDRLLRVWRNYYAANKSRIDADATNALGLAGVALFLGLLLVFTAKIATRISREFGNTTELRMAVYRFIIGAVLGRRLARALKHGLAPDTRERAITARKAWD